MTLSSDPILNTNQLPISLDVDLEDPRYQSILSLYLRRVANAVNTKESGLFLLQETASFEQWFNATTQTSGTNQQNRNGYRLTTDLVALNLVINGLATIPPGTTSNLQLTANTTPRAPTNDLYPVHGFGGAKDTAGIYYFPSDPNVTISFNSSTNTYIVVNNTGNALVQLYFVIEYLKN